MRILHFDRFEVAGSDDVDNLALQLDANVFFSVQLVDEILRHAGGEFLAAHEDCDAARIAGKEHRGLSRRVAAADDKHVLAARAERLGAGRAVIDAAPEQSLDSGNRKSAPRYAVGQNDRLGFDAVAAIQERCACVVADG